MELHLKNKKAFISGSTSGIGYAIAKQLLQEGAEVIIVTYMASPLSSATNGAALRVDGGVVKTIF